MVFKYLGTHAKFEGLDTFPTPDGCDLVQLRCTEVTARCPVTNQPDFYEVFVEYAPGENCLETKSLKMYFETLRELGIFAEALAPKIRNDIAVALRPLYITVEIRQGQRGGIQIIARSEA